jgi:uncharacterized membrane protein YfcA
MTLYELLICAVAGVGAGLGTGFAGMSAANVISPMLIAFLGVDPYAAIGIALASDVLASAVSALTYSKHKNIDIQNGSIMMASVLFFTFLASWVSSFFPSRTVGMFAVYMTLFTGLRFLFRPVMTTKETLEQIGPKKRLVQSIVCGAFIGSICGFVGAGGGMMMLLILTGVLGYELKTAVGTSVFIMTFTALTGSISHFTIAGGVSHWGYLIACALFTFAFAQLGALIANRSTPKTLNRATGLLLTVLGIVIVAVSFVRTH